MYPGQQGSCERSWFHCKTKGWVTKVPIQRDIYPNLKLRIYTSGLRQNRMAKMLGIDEAHLSKVVNGFREPSNDLRTQIAEILHCDPEWLFHKVFVTEDNPVIDNKTMQPNK
jgi:transcriptional regulator with XRE-family HTH domain